MEGFRQWFEMSYTQEDIPPYFYVCPEFSAEALASGVLNGLTGISEHWSALFFFLRDGVMLQMPGKETAQLNNLSRILYTNPEYFTSNNFAALRRIAGSENLFDFMITKAASEALKKLGIEHNDLMQVGLQNTTDLNQLTTVLKNKYNVADWGKLRKLLADEIKNHTTVDTFTKEREWVTKKQWQRTPGGVQQVNKLVIPKGSTLYLMEGKMLRRQRVREHGLEQIYNVVWYEDKQHLARILQGVKNAV